MTTRATRVYISGSFQELEDLQEFANFLRAYGYNVTSSWMYEPEALPDLEWVRRARANEDVEDIRRADVFVMSSEMDTHNGGRHTELGIAIAERKSIHVYGPRPNTFMYVNQDKAWKNQDDIRTYIKIGGHFG